MKQKKRQQGFTLIELMAVVAILAILATIAIPQVVEAVARARTNTNQANRALLESAIRRFHMETGEWPSGAGGVTRGIPNALAPDYIDAIPALSGMPANTNWILQWWDPGGPTWRDWPATAPVRTIRRIQVVIP